MLTVRLLTYCYSEVYEEKLADQAHAIMDTWKQEELTPEQVEIMEGYRILSRISIREK